MINADVREWGEFLVLHQSPNTKVKRLVINPGKSISMQYHNHRAELWFIESGEGNLYTMTDNGEFLVKKLHHSTIYHVEVGQWHRVECTSDKPLCVIEIQYGESCVEEDIVRK